MSASFKVYVVDDDPVVLDIMHAILEPDCQVETFPSAEDCLMQLESEKPDFFLLDVNLPGMDGYTLCRTLKNQPKTCEVPVIFISAPSGRVTVPVKESRGKMAAFPFSSRTRPVRGVSSIPSHLPRILRFPTTQISESK